MYKTIPEITEWLHNYGIRNYTINDDMTVDIDGDLRLSKKRLSKLKVQFRYVSKNCWLDCNRLKTLEGAPYEVGGGFCCRNNHLTSLKFAPKKICTSERDFWRQNSFDCTWNHLKSLEGLEEINQFDNPQYPLFNKNHILFCLQNNPNIVLDKSFNLLLFNIDQCVLDRYHLNNNINIKELVINENSVAYDDIKQISTTTLIALRLKRLGELVL